MSDVNLAVTLGPVSFPAGTVLGSITAALTGTLGTDPPAQTVAAGTTQVSFLSVPADTYTYTVTQLDSNGNALGSPITGQVVVAAPATVTLDVPTAVVATAS